ncbi:MAG: type IX secretion system membrane protein PorP/SprF [Lutimonas sp.]
MIKKSLLILFLLLILKGHSQETFPVNFDYLSDNVYLIHPAAAGIGNCGKFRLTYGQSFFGIENGPSLQTLNFHNRFWEKAAVGAIIFNDQNGYHAKRGFLGTYAYHLAFDKGYHLNQLSFGLSFMYLQNSVDQSDFFTDDPIISGNTETSNYFNADFGLSYHNLNYFGYFTIKNILESKRDLVNSSLETENLRRYLFTIGGVLNQNKDYFFEPSIMGQYIEYTKETWVDFNLKTFRKLNREGNQLWVALSYRQSFDSSDLESLKQITPMVGVNINRWLLSYNYTHQLGDVVFQNSVNHQITVGFNLECVTEITRLWDIQN